MTARPVNPAKPGGRSGAPPSAMVAEVAAAIWAKSHGDCGTWNEIPDHWKPPFYEQAIAAIAAMFDNLPLEAMARAECAIMCGKGCKCRNWQEHQQYIDAAISAARDQVLGSAKGDA